MKKAVMIAHGTSALITLARTAGLQSRADLVRVRAMDDDLEDCDFRAKRICADLYGSCTCLLSRRAACAAMLSLVENDEDAGDEMDRISESSEGKSDG